MLRIKDNVDLKELEKYGFVEKKVKQTATLEEKNIGYELEVDGDFIFVGQDRKILILINYHSKIEDVLYDLIKAGLVEKVEE